jgi:hypothetical protein
MWKGIKMGKIHSKKSFEYDILQYRLWFYGDFSQLVENKLARLNNMSAGSQSKHCYSETRKKPNFGNKSLYV